MAELISRVRRLVGDPAGPSQTFADDDLQAALDRTQIVVRYALLRPEPSPAPGGLIDVAAYRDYYASVGDWEADEQLFDGAWQPLVPTTADRLTGHWTFAGGVLPPVRIVGKVYDVYLAAADVLEQQAALVKLEFDFSSDGQQLQRSQRAKALLALAEAYRRRAKPARAWQTRDDLAPAEWSPRVPLGWNAAPDA
jgi:hypothetical protein